VAVRVRPIAPASGASTLTCTEQQVTVGGADYCFDRVFDACASQACVYDELNVKQLVEAAFAGVSSSVLAYGQTGAGKTHTMLGDACSVEQPFDEPRCAVDSGVIPRALVDLFEMAEQQLGSGALQTVSVRLTCVEVYCDKLRDLLALNAVDEVAAAVRLPPSPSTRLFSPPASGRPSLGGSRRASMGGGRELGGSEIMLREGRGGMIAIEGANTFEIGSARDALRCVRAAAAARTTGSTAMNLQSSRSHAVFTLRVETTAPDGSSAGIVRKSACELVFVDLAGSEGSKKSGAEGDRQREAIHINLGLHHLNNVIHELATQQRGSRSSGVHVNYRNCKLTRCATARAARQRDRTSKTDTVGRLIGRDRQRQRRRRKPRATCAQALPAQSGDDVARTPLCWCIPAHPARWRSAFPPVRARRQAPPKLAGRHCTYVHHRVREPALGRRHRDDGHSQVRRARAPDSHEAGRQRERRAGRPGASGGADRRAERARQGARE
jgi:hypothetical protein